MYQGYANYPTWAICLWIDNEQGSYEDMLDTVERCEDMSDYELEQELKAYVDELYIPETVGMAADLLRYAFDEADFGEIAKHYRDIIKDNQSYL
jgi:hypothetical protein